MESKFDGRKRNESRIAAGLILVIIGAALLLRNIGFPLPNWLFSWPVILILVGFYSGIKHNFRNNAWFVLMGIGGFFLVDRFIPEITLEPYFWPIGIIIIGVIFIIRPARKKLVNFNSYENNTDPGSLKNSSWTEQGSSQFTADSSDFINISSVFSGVQRKVVSKTFQGGKLSCIFGGADVDLMQADISGRVEITLEVVFGGAKLIIPSHWTVQNEIDGVFHGVDDKRKFSTATDANSGKTLVLKGSVVFGGVEIKSY